MRPSVLNGLFLPVSSIQGIGPKLSSLIEKACGKYTSDVLFSMPSGVLYRPYIERKKELVHGALATILFEVISHQKPLKRSQPYKVKGIYRKQENKIEKNTVKNTVTT